MLFRSWQLALDCDAGACHGTQVNFIGSIKEGRMRLGSEMSRFPADPPNFSSFPVALIVLIQLILGDEWHHIMWDASVQPPEVKRYNTLDP